MSIEIYGKPLCPYCDMAKALCETRKLPFKYFQLGTDFTVHGTKIGGYDKLGTYLEETGYNGTGHSL